VEEIGRTKPRTVSELMEVANRFADGEDVYNNKRGGTRKATKTGNSRQEEIMEQKNQNTLAHRQRTCYTDLVEFIMHT
jgi:hypothetical protein